MTTSYDVKDDRFQPQEFTDRETKLSAVEAAPCSSHAVAVFPQLLAPPSSPMNAPLSSTASFSPQETTPSIPPCSQDPAFTTRPPQDPTASTTPPAQDPTPTTPPPTAACGASSEAAAEAGGERRQRRKPLHPQKTLSLMDPNFRGVTLCFQTIVHGATSELVITPIYSKNLARFQRRRRRLCFNSENEPDTSQSPGQESLGSGQQQTVSQRARPPGPTLGSAVKSCASCATRRTPLWRDAEDGTPLCNACGIRYRKYRLRCGSCWHIPRKDNKVFPACSQCGGVLRFCQTRKC